MISQQDFDLFLSFFNDFAVYFPAINVCIWWPLFAIYNPKCRGGKKNSFASVLLFFIGTNFAYVDD